MADETIDIEYIGPKQLKRDTVNETGVTWVGTGDVQPYPSTYASRLLFFKDVWRRADGKRAVVRSAMHDIDGGEEIAKTPADKGYKVSPPYTPEPKADIPDERTTALREALAMVGADDLNARGYPKVEVVRDISGFDDVSGKEIAALWPKGD